MAQQEGLFTVGEDDLQEEMLVVAEEDYGEWTQPRKPEPMPSQGERPEPMSPAQNRALQSWRESKDINQFTQFLRDEVDRIGNPAAWRTMTEKERGLGQLKQLNSYISQALRSDYDSVLDAGEIDTTRNKLEQQINSVEDALFGVQKMKQQRKKMRRRGDEEHDITKEATAPHFNGIQIVVTPFERAIVGSLINGKVSGGRDIEELYAEAKKKYDLTDREELSVFQILADFGFATFKDRLRLGEDQDPTRESGFGEWSSQYYA